MDFIFNIWTQQAWINNAPEPDIAKEFSINWCPRMGEQLFVNYRVQDQWGIVRIYTYRGRVVDVVHAIAQSDPGYPEEHSINLIVS
jgi:hypothetical protein